MTSAEEILKQVLNNSANSKNIGSADAFRNNYDANNYKWKSNQVDIKTPIKSVIDKSSNNPVLSTALALAAGLILKKGQFFRQGASNMKNFIDGYYAKGISKINKGNLLAKEFYDGTKKSARKLISPELELAKMQTGLEPAIKQSIDELYSAKNILLKNSMSWQPIKKGASGVVGQGLLTDGARSTLTKLDKKIAGEFHNAFALMVRKDGLDVALKSPLAAVIKPLATYKRYAYKGKNTGFNELAKDMNIDDPEVLTTGLGAWNMNLKNAVSKKKLNVANFKLNQTQNQVQDVQFSQQGKLAFLAHEKGLIGKNKDIKKLQQFFIDNGYKDKGRNIFRIGSKKNGQNVVIRKTKKGTTHVQFSPSRKGNFHWGGFNGNIIFPSKGKYKGQMGVFGTDVYDVPFDKLANLRPTPLLNVQSVKYKKVPILKSKETPVYKENNPSRNEYSGNAPKKPILELEEAIAKPYGIKETKAYSPDVEEYFSTINKSPKQRANLKSYTRNTKYWNDAVETYYKHFTKVSQGKATQIEINTFLKAKAQLGLETVGPAIGAATALSIYSNRNKD